MDSLLYSRITKDFLNLDPSLISGRERYRLGWSGSVLVPHKKAAPLSKKKKKANALLALRKRFANLFDQREIPSIPLSTAPQLTRPAPPSVATFRPAWYFSKGMMERDKKKYPDPIPYLLTETNETAKARPVPGNSLIFRSLCKGKGVLKKNAYGLIYLDVDDLFISMMLPYLKVQGLVKPPYFNLFGSPQGAHIPVISAREAAFEPLDEIQKLEKEFTFEIEGLYSMEPTSWPEVEQVWFFKVRSDSLEDLRRSHFLPALPGGHSFHIAVAIKPRVSNMQSPHPLPLMRINPSFIAA